MPRELVLSRHTRKFLLKLTDARLEARLREHLDQIAVNPLLPGAEKLKGMAHAYRVRVGDYRIVYEIDPHSPVIFVSNIGDRKDIYR